MKNILSVTDSNIPARASKEESQERVQTFLKMILEGKTNAEILAWGSNEWQIATTSCYNYLQKAMEQMAEWRTRTRDELIDDALQKYNFLYREAIKSKNLKEARNVINDIVKLLGIQAPAQLQIDETVRSININFTIPPA